MVSKCSPKREKQKCKSFKNRWFLQVFRYWEGSWGGLGAAFEGRDLVGSALKAQEGSWIAFWGALGGSLGRLWASKRPRGTSTGSQAP